MPAPTVADALASLWAAVDNWPALQGLFAQKMRFSSSNSHSLEDLEPSISDFPCLAIQPAAIDPKTFTTQTQQWDIAFDVIVWTQDWDFDRALPFVDPIIAAIHKSCPPDSQVSYIKTATGYHIDKPVPVKFLKTTLGDSEGEAGTRAIMTTFTPTLRINRNPFI